MPTGIVSRRWYLAFAAAFLLTLAGFLGPRALALGSANPITNAADFRAFYCAGSTLVARHDPYLVEPLRTCERNALEQMHLLTYRDLVIPAPLPPYALLGFGLLSFVPFKAATCVWFAGLLVATMATVVSLRAMSGLPAIVVTLVAVCCAAPAVLLGQMAPFTVALLLATAWAAKHRRWWPCAIACVLLSIEPHLALPAVTALGLFVKPSRMPIAICFGLVFAVSVAISGVGIYETYVASELPVHSLSEVHALQTQYSLTTALATLAHVSDDAAVIAGRADYALMLVFGLVVARRLAAKLDDDRFYVFIPPAFTALGGMFSHAYSLYVAVPAIFLCLSLDSVRNRAWYLWALSGLTVSLLVDAAFSDDFIRANPRKLEALLRLVSDPDGLASRVSRVWQTARMPTSSGAIMTLALFKVPALAGLIVFIVLSTAFAFRRRGLSVVRRSPLAGTLRRAG